MLRMVSALRCTSLSLDTLVPSAGVFIFSKSCMNRCMVYSHLTWLSRDVRPVTSTLFMSSHWHCPSNLCCSGSIEQPKGTPSLELAILFKAHDTASCGVLERSELSALMGQLSGALFLLTVCRSCLLPGKHPLARLRNLNDDCSSSFIRLPSYFHLRAALTRGGAAVACGGAACSFKLTQS